MKMVFIVADGMGDWPVEDLGNLTPLQAAKTPNMDLLASKGITGVAKTVPPEMAPGSDVANMALLGYDPKRYLTGRGPIEAAAQGLELAPNDLVWRMNLVSLSELGANGFMHDYSAGHVPSEVSVPLVQGLQQALGNDTFTFYPGVQYRHLLVQKGGADDPAAKLAATPPHDITDKSIAGAVSAYQEHPELWKLIQKAAEYLATNANTSKATSIWPWGQGTPLSLPPFRQATNLSGAVVSAVDLVRGLGRAADMRVLHVEGATGLVDTNYEGKVQAALDFLKTGDFVFIHLEGPDECGHMGDAQCKVTALERIDSLVLGPMLQALQDEPAVFVVTCDHLTPLALKTHHADPVPFVLWWQGMNTCGAGKAQIFSEEQSAQGEHVNPGHTLLAWMLDKVRQGSSLG